MRAYMWDRMKDWLLTGAIETDEKMATDLAGPGYHINRSNLLVLESKAGTAGSTARARGCDEPHSKRLTKTRHRADLAARRQRLHGGITGALAGWRSRARDADGTRQK